MLCCPLLSLAVGTHPEADRADRRQYEAERDALLATAGFTRCTRLAAYILPAGSPYERQHRIVGDTVHALHSLGFPVIHTHHAASTPAPRPQYRPCCALLEPAGTTPSQALPIQ
ncbi:hypothetical protein OG607_41350 [Streptomyces sp. NBC_01537]|uniref:hypothetical protein n=1 Tax=Streptomyces sp. NBC_01537 TaxID=2903896 RepID=UPI00386ABF18